MASLGASDIWEEYYSHDLIHGRLVELATTPQELNESGFQLYGVLRGLCFICREQVSWRWRL